ncbi:MAG TPA: hypothetical protein VFD91_12735, partial [Mariniphaga sp.]|nr:hypothetical protein [Mariniphaga sp.]
MKFKISLLLLITIFYTKSFIHAEETDSPSDPPFMVLQEDFWVKETLNRMSLDEKIAQLMMITVYPRQSEADKDNIISEIVKHQPKGILVMQGSPVKTARWINEFQINSKVPLLVAIDGEWGLSMRIDSTIK